MSNRLAIAGLICLALCAGLAKYTTFGSVTAAWLGLACLVVAGALAHEEG